VLTSPEWWIATLVESRFEETHCFKMAQDQERFSIEERLKL
jgi:hypothetical protein